MTNKQALGEPIAVIGMGCRYPGARDPRELWENILAKRQAFRRMPDCRLPLSEYGDPDGKDLDKTYVERAALIDGFEFDWIGHRIPKQTVESTDIAHWLALDVALKATADAGYNKETLPRERTGVIVGNTLTGEFSRATNMRVRWPYVEKSIRMAAAQSGLGAAATDQLIVTVEQKFKSGLPAFNEDTLAGNLSNTIAGRICNFLNLQGGGYTVDGACASSVLSIATAANALSVGDIDVALAGGVDVSLDPFELVGFARVGALSNGDMRVYDRASNGFLPGEGCGFVVLKRLTDARADGDYVYAVLHGWGVSSDGSGGITAPDRRGQSLAIRRAYDRAGFSPLSLHFVEGHGTGTPVGDPVELGAIATALDAFGKPTAGQCGVTSFKSLVGHTKAAAGIGGFIKATIAVNRRVIPPTANCTDPNPTFQKEARALYPVRHGEVRAPGETLRAGVSAMGFGGMNTHATIESRDPPATNLAPSLDERALLASHQDTEVFLLTAGSLEDLRHRVAEIGQLAEGMSVGELTDLGARLASELTPGAAWRAAVVAGSPSELHGLLTEAESALQSESFAESGVYRAANDRLWVACKPAKPRVGFVFPGQGSQQVAMAGALVDRFQWARELVREADQYLAEVGAEPMSPLIFRNLDRASDRDMLREWQNQLTRTDIAQPAICLASLLWTRFLARIGVQPHVVGGHSLGELSALCAAGAFDEKTLLQLAALRGRAMANVDYEGTMASLGCDLATAEQLIRQVDGYAVVANINSPKQMTISGDRAAVARAVALAKEKNISAAPLAVSGAFHSRHVQDASEALRGLEMVPDKVGPLRARVISAMDGSVVAEGQDLRDYLSRQILSRVDFVSLTKRMGQDADLIIEVGPGPVLSGLMRRTLGKEAVCLSIESKPSRDRDLNIAVAALFAHGLRVRPETLYENRLHREFVPASERKFIENPCERPSEASLTPIQVDRHAGSTMLPPASSEADVFSRDVTSIAEPLPAPAPLPDVSLAPASVLDQHDALKSGVVRKGNARDTLLDALAKLTGFPGETLTDDLRLLDDLHLDSIKAVELISEAAIALGIGQLDPGEFSNASIVEIIAALEERQTEAPGPNTLVAPAEAPSKPPRWTRNFVMQRVDAPLPPTDASDDPWVSKRVLVVASSADAASTAGLRSNLQGRGAKSDWVSFDRLTPEAAAGFDHFVVLAPRIETGESDERALNASVAWLTAVAHALPTTPHGDSPTCIAFVRWADDPLGWSGYFRPGHDSFVATLHLERRQLRFRTVILEDAGIDVMRVLDMEFRHDSTFEQVSYGRDGQRTVLEPVLLDNDHKARKKSLEAGDVVLVTGGARGITAECALALAGATGVRMVLVGSSPNPDMEPARASSSAINSTLTRFRKKDLWCEYRACDVTNREQVRALVNEVQEEVGAIAGVIHGAGLNYPGRAHEVSAEEALAEVGPKLKGALHLFEAFEATPPRVFVALTSIIGAVGMPRNAWYAFSNETLERSLGRFGERHPETEVLAIAYSIWDEIGMGANLGSLEHLSKIGTEAVPVEEGAKRFVELVTNDPGVREVIVTSKLGGIDTWRPSAPPPPSTSRFLDKIISFQPGVELTVRTRLTLERDPYLRDHNYKGSYLFPTVFGLEAMGQAVAHVMGRSSFVEPVMIEDIDLSRPLSVTAERGLEIEIRAHVLEATDTAERVEVGIRCEQTGFARDHFSARFVLGAEVPTSTTDIESPEESLALDPKRHLYGDILFQGPRFQRIKDIYELDAKRCVFHAERQDSDEWILGDPYFRDALLQSVQLCVTPDQCLPVRIANLVVRPRLPAANNGLSIASIDGLDGNTYHTSVWSFDSSGKPAEVLTGYEANVVAVGDTWPTAELLAKRGVKSEVSVGAESVTRSKQQEQSQSSGNPARAAEWDGGRFYKAAPGAGPEGQTVFEYRFPLAAQDAVTVGRTIHFSSYARWAGRTRELAVVNTPDLHERLYELLGSNVFGGATNSFETWIHDFPDPTDLIETHFWIDRSSSFDYDAVWKWWRVSYPEGERRLVASSRMRVSAIDIVDHGIIRTGQWPEFLDRSLREMGPQHPKRLDNEEPNRSFVVGETLYESSDTFERGPQVCTRTFETTLRDSNLVGNLYYGNFAAWQGHVRDAFFQGLGPDFYRGKGEHGQLLCTNFAINFLREAMPFELVQVDMHVHKVTECGVCLAFEYFRLDDNGDRTKLAVSKHEAAWMKRDDYGLYIPTSWPQEILTGLLEKVRSAPLRGASNRAVV